MKNLKQTVFILIFLIGGICHAQINNPNNAPFVGTWEYQNGDQIFRLHIWEQNVPNPHSNEYYIHGDYEMIQVDPSGQETLIYTSIPNSFPNWPGAYTGDVNPDGSLSGAFQETHIGSSGLNGWFKIEKIPTCSTCPAKISWDVTVGVGVRAYPIGVTPPTDFEVPDNIVLTKIYILQPGD